MTNSKLRGVAVRPVALTPQHDLKTLVENRTVFNFNNCELNIFETHQTSEQVLLRFQGMVFTTMLRGKKVMHVQDTAPFAYLPGESVILPESAPMVIDFPEASMLNPTQCIALEIDRQKISDTLNLLNERFPKVEESGPWRIDLEQFHIHNSLELSDTVNRLMRLPGEHYLTKDALANITLQELLIRLLQTQARAVLMEQSATLQSSHRFAYVVQYIREHLTENFTVQQLASLACMSKPHFFRSFKRELGLSPLDFILQERIQLAKRLLSDPNISVSEAGYQSGFNNLTHFALQFKKTEGVPPSQYKKVRG
ncbi:MAG TPA: AraC family transcriptional regulator [Saprospiraceae bacterium]|nr:AraC family transcriptional regulator [Saprospiraceae bacterium]HPI07490.1 AraC family transcriptional regulator [Saprospiraceae bacterium]